jgi:type I restriction enzyme R subunit
VERPEDKARAIIDAKLGTVGWAVQDFRQLDLSAKRGIAVRNFPLRTGFADYLLYMDRKAVGVVEAKPQGHTLTGVEPQSAKYTEGLPADLPAYHRPLPFAYESTGTETRFTNNLDPDPRSRDVFHFHRPETLLEYAQAPRQLRAGLRNMPPLIPGQLWSAQIEAIQNLERSFALARPRALIQMATGSGKTFMAANFAYRLIKHAGARRILFLVDRTMLGRQTENEFRQFRPPDDGRSFGDIYNIQRLKGNSIGPVNRVVITTVQRLYSILRGQADFDAESEEGSMFDTARPPWAPPTPIEYNPAVPIETFDFIVTDECHRSIYHLWRQVLEYFDAFLIGLTATPSKQTIGFFDRNLVMEYGHARAVADSVNVGFDVYRIRTRITEKGSTVEAGLHVDKRDRLTRRVRYEQLDDDLTYTANDLDRDVVAEDQIRTVIRAFRDKLPEIFPRRTEVPKTLIFAKDDSHAEDIVNIVREEFGKGNDFCQKITYRTGCMRVPAEGGGFAWKKIANMTPEDVLTAFRNSFNPRIAVTVDMVATGTDVKPLEIVMFMRNVGSASYFEQMKGRGVRVMDPDALKAVTPDAKAKTRFVVIDCVGVCERDKTESAPLDRQPSVSLQKLLNHVAMGGRDPEVLSTLAARFARMNQEITAPQSRELAQLAGGQDLSAIAGKLVKAIDPDAQEDAARQANGLPEGAEPTAEQVRQAAERLTSEAVRPILSAGFRNRLLEIKQATEQTIDRASLDEVTQAGFDAAALDKARGRVESFRQWIEDHKAEIMALQLIYSRRYANRVKFEDVKELAARIQRPPLAATPEELWRAYEALDKSKVRGSGGRQLADIVSLILHAARPDEPLTPFQSVVMQRYRAWLDQQATMGTIFTPEQREWLDRIAEHIATSVVIEREDFSLGWFAQHGELGRAHQLFGNRLDDILKELNERLVA